MAQSIEVLVRPRPLISITEAEGGQISVDPEKNRISIFRKKNKRATDFQFAKVFDSQASQEEVYKALDVVRLATEGISGCVLAYGQTNSGKTYTMYGDPWPSSSSAAKTSAPPLRSSSALDAAVLAEGAEEQQEEVDDAAEGSDSEHSASTQ
eukprot:gene47783-58538_t